MRCHTQFLGRKQKRAWSKKPYSYIYAAEPLDSLIQFFPKGAISLGTLEDVNDPRTGQICLLLWIVQKKVAAICQINNHQLGNCHGLIQSKQRLQQGKRINQLPFHLILLITHRPSNGTGRQRGDQREALTVFRTPYISMNYEACVIFDKLNIP